MSEDIQTLQSVEKMLIKAMHDAASTVECIAAEDKTTAGEHCASFLQSVQESQKLVLGVADKYVKAVDYEANDIASKVSLAAETTRAKAQGG